MWNGLWKITAMVGVIGVGLFAAYQAQQGMNHSVSMSPENSGVNEDDRESAVSSTTDRPIVDAPDNDFASDVFANSDSDPRSPNSPRRKKSSSEPRNDFLDDIADERPASTKAVVSKNSNAVASKRSQRPGAEFLDDAEDLEKSINESPAKPRQLPDEQLSNDPATKKVRQLIRQVNALTGDQSAPAESDADPFAADTVPSTGTAEKNESPAEPTAKTSIENAKVDSVEPVEAPGRARISTDSSTESEPPRSKRAKQSAIKRVEQPVQTEANPFDKDPPAEIPISAGDSRLLPGAPSLGAPEPLDSAEPSAIPNRRNSNPQSIPARLPADPQLTSDDAAQLPSSPDRPLPKRNPTNLRAQYNSDPIGESPNENPVRSRDPQAAYDRVMPVDMVGDGVAGDASQRGVQQPRLTIEKVAKQQAVLDQPLVYTIIVKNMGTVDAHNVVVEDQIPKGTRLEGTSPQAELAGKRLIWNQQVLKPNEEKRISIKVTPLQEGPIGSVARVYFATDVTAEIVVNAPQLEFTVKAPSEVRVGQRFDLVFNLKNIGKVDANNIIVRDLVPEQLKHEAGGDIECPIGKMAPQEVREIVLPVVATKTGTVLNKAIMTADSGVKKSLDSSIDIVGEVLVLTRTGQNRLYVERPAVFTNNIRNEGNQRADRVKISEIVPAGMEFETASDGGKYDANLRAVVWTVGPLAPGSDKSVTVKYVPKETGTLAAKITAIGGAGSTAAVNSTVDVIGKPELQMETMTATGAVTVGDRITSRFQLNNTGTASATNVQLKVRLPRELRLISVKGAKFQQKEDYLLLETIGELAPRSKAAYELVLEPIAEADAQISLEISADHLVKPGRRVETIQIARDALK